MRTFLSIFILCLCVFVTGCADGNDPPPAVDAKTDKAPKPPNPNKPPKDDPPPTEPPPVVILTWAVNGLLADQGSLSGTVSYEAAAVPEVIDGDSYYTLTDWQLILPFTTVHPALTFTKSNGTGGLCVGVCRQNTWRGTIPANHFFFDNGSQRIEVEWLKMEGVALPQTQADWGGVYLPNSWLRWLYVPGVTNNYMGFQTASIHAVLD